MFQFRPPAPSSSTPALSSTSTGQLPQQHQGHSSSVNLALPATSTVKGLANSPSSIGLSPSSATTTPVGAMNGGPSPISNPSTPQVQDPDLFAQLARLKQVQLSLALDHANSPDTPTTPTATTGGTFISAGISPVNVAGLTGGSNSTAGGVATNASAPTGTAGSSRGNVRNPTGGGAAADPSLEDAGVSPEAAANKTKDRFAVKRDQAAVMTAKLADLRAVMRDITTTARTLHSQAATNPLSSAMPMGGQAPAQAATLDTNPSTTRPISFLSPLAPSAITTSASSRSPALGLVPRGPSTSVLLPNQTSGLTGSPEMVSGLMGPSTESGGWAARNGSRVVDR